MLTGQQQTQATHCLPGFHIFGKKFTQSPFGGLSTANFEDLSIPLDNVEFTDNSKPRGNLVTAGSGYVVAF